MQNYTLVLPEHLNQYGYLFGGYLLKWVDEHAWIAASLDFPGCNFVTKSLDQVVFNKSVKQGSILKFVVNKKKQGTTSVQYGIEAFHGNHPDNPKPMVFSTCVTLVRIDEHGKKQALPK